MAYAQCTYRIYSSRTRQMKFSHRKTKNCTPLRYWEVDGWDVHSEFEIELSDNFIYFHNLPIWWQIDIDSNANGRVFRMIFDECFVLSVQKRSQVENLLDAAAMYYSLILPLASVWVDIYAYMCVCVCMYCVALSFAFFFSLPDLPLFFMYFFVSEKPHPERLIYLQSFVFHMFSHITRIGPCTPSIFHSFLPPFGMFDSGSNCRMVI